MTEQQADVTATIALSNAEEQAAEATLKIRVLDGKKVVTETERTVCVEGKSTKQMASLPLSITKPHLWNGTADPFIYRAEVTLCKTARKSTAWNSRWACAISRWTPTRASSSTANT